MDKKPAKKSPSPDKGNNLQASHMYINILPLVQPAGLLFGILAFYIALSNGIDIVESMFRGILVFGGFVIVILIFNYFYILMIKQVREREAKRIMEEKLKAQEEAVKAEEEKNRLAAQSGQTA